MRIANTSVFASPSAAASPRDYVRTVGALSTEQVLVGRTAWRKNERHGAVGVAVFHDARDAAKFADSIDAALRNGPPRGTAHVTVAQTSRNKVVVHLAGPRNAARALSGHFDRTQAALIHQGSSRRRLPPGARPMHSGIGAYHATGRLGLLRVGSEMRTAGEIADTAAAHGLAREVKI